MENKEIVMPPLPEEPEQAIEAVEEQPEQNVEVESDTLKVESKPAPSSKDINMANLRTAKEKLERENAEILRRLQEYESKKETLEDNDIEIGDDELFEGKHYKKIQKQIKAQQDQIKQYESQLKLTSTEVRLKSQFPDFDKVINEENITKLKEAEPEIADAISNTTDMYSKAVSAYKMIKKLGLYVEDNYQPDRDLAIKNSLKPKPLASVSPQQGDSPLSRANAFANGLTPELKKQLWKEMEEAANKY